MAVWRASSCHAWLLVGLCACALLVMCNASRTDHSATAELDLDLQVLEATHLHQHTAHIVTNSLPGHKHKHKHHHKRKHKRKHKKSQFVVVANNNAMKNFMAAPDTIDHAALEEMGRKDDKEDYHKHGHEAKTKQNERKFKHQEKQQAEETEKRRERKMKKHHHEVFQKKLQAADKKNARELRDKEEKHRKANQKKEEEQKKVITASEKKFKGTVESGRKSEAQRKTAERKLKHEARTKQAHASEGKVKQEQKQKHLHQHACHTQGLRRSRSNVDVCCGVTQPGQWRRYAHRMVVHVNTAHCGFTGTPHYFSTTSGTSSHWTKTGHSQHYNPTKRAFSVYITAPWGSQHRFRYQLRWCGFGQRRTREIRDGSSTRNVRMCCGKGNQHWKAYGGNMVKHLDMRACQFTRTPQIFTSLGGTSSHWTLKGSDAVYSPNVHGFNVYIYGSNLHRARQYQYKLQWCAVGPARGQCEGPRVLDERSQVVSRNARICCGVAPQHWRDYSSNGVTMRVNTGHCRFSSRVRYYSALRGTSHHWTTTGGNHIYGPNAGGFSVYVAAVGWRVRTSHARNFRWHIDWCGVDY